MGHILRSILPIVGDALAVATGNPELIPLIQGGGTLLNGGSPGDALKSAGLAFAGQEILPVLGNEFSSAFPETAASLGVGGGANSLTDLFGQTSGGGSLTGAGTIGGDILGNFNPSSGLSQLFGGTSAPTSDLQNQINAINTNAPNPETTAGATNPVNFAPGGASSSYVPAGSPGSAGVGGGTLTGFGGPSSSIGEASSLPSASTGGNFNFDLSGNAATPSGLGAGAGVGTNTPGFNFDINGNPAGDASFSAPSQLANAAGSAITPNIGGSNVASSGINMNSLIRGGLGALFSNNNNKGYDAQINAGNQVQQDYAPYAQTGQLANTQLQGLFGLNGNGAQAAAQANWQNTPGYQFALDQGLKAVNADAAAKGQILSGNNQQAVQQFGTGLANQTYNNYLTNLIGQQQQGVNAAGGVASGQLGVANAQAGKSGAAANTQNAGLGMGLSGLFPQANPFASITGGNGGMNNMLAALFAGNQPQNAFSGF